VSKPDQLGYRGMRTGSRAAQMHVTNRQRNLQPQRDQRQYRTAALMAMNPAHPPNHPPTRLRLPTMLTLHCNAEQAGKLFNAILRR